MKMLVLNEAVDSISSSVCWYWHMLRRMAMCRERHWNLRLWVKDERDDSTDIEEVC